MITVKNATSVLGLLHSWRFALFGLQLVWLKQLRFEGEGTQEIEAIAVFSSDKSG
jgi:hypothetical protein